MSFNKSIKEMTTKGVQHSFGFRKKAIKFALELGDNEAATRQLHIGKNLLRSWINEFEADEADAIREMSLKS